MSQENGFFASSDEEGEDVQMASCGASNRVLESDAAGDSRESERLFLASSDDEEEVFAVDRFETPIPQRTSIIENRLESLTPHIHGVDVPSSEGLSRASSVSSVDPNTSHANSPRARSSSEDLPPSKKRRISPLPSEAEPLSILKEDIAQASTLQPFEEAFIGSFLVGNAWSTVKGRGYIKPGDPVLIERYDSGSANTQTKGKKSKQGEKSAGKGKSKQLNLATMLKSGPKPSLANAKKKDTIVRLTNASGFEFGRLPSDISAWVCHLMDLGMKLASLDIVSNLNAGLVQFHGSTLVDAPETLRSGVDIIVSLSVYMRATAFASSPASKSTKSSLASIINEGHETNEEHILRERKISLLKLFDAINLKPRRGAGVTQRVKESISDKDLEGLASIGKRESSPVKKEIVGDGEVIEVQEDEELSEIELNAIYKRSPLLVRMIVHYLT
jgi:DNA repair protein RAD5